MEKKLTTKDIIENSPYWPLISTAIILFLIWYPIYIAWNNFSIERFSRFVESIVEYKYRILFVIITNLIIILLKASPSKKPKILKLFLTRRIAIVCISIFVYPFLPDFQQRFGKIADNNITDFYTIFLPIFIMFALISIMKTWDNDFLKEMEGLLSIKSKTNYKTESLVINFSKSIIFLGYSFLFLIFIWRLCTINKIDSWYKDIIIRYPIIILCFILGINILLHTILKNKSEKEPKYNNTSENIKGTKKKTT